MGRRGSLKAENKTIVGLRNNSQFIMEMEILNRKA
jgi:hypothetical protein